MGIERGETESACDACRALQTLIQKCADNAPPHSDVLLAVIVTLGCDDDKLRLGVLTTLLDKLNPPILLVDKLLSAIVAIDGTPSRTQQ